MADLVAKIKLKDGSELAIGKTFINSLNSVSQSTTDAGSVHYGILANSGIMEIQDGNNYISDLVDNGSLPISDLDVKIEVDGKVIQEHITTDSDYNTEDNIFNVSMSNFIKDFDILKYKGYPYPETSKTLYDLFYDVLESYYQPQYPNETYPAFIDNMFESSVLAYIKAITIDYPVIEYGKTYRKILDELCTIAQLNMFADANNKPKFISARPVYDSTEQINELKWKNIVDSLKYTKTLKNKFDGVEISETNVNDLIDYSCVVNTSKGSIFQYNFYGFMGTNPTLFDATYGVGGKIECSYSSGQYSFSSKSNDRLQSVIDVLLTGSADSDGYYNIQLRNDVLPYSVTYDKYSGWFTNESQALADIKRDSGVAPYPDPPYTGSVFLRTEYINNVNFNTEIGSYSGKIPNSFMVNNYTVSMSDNSWIKVKFDKTSNIVYVKYYLLTRSVFYYLSTNHFNNFRDGSYIYKQIATEYNISIYGDERKITFNQISASTDGIENCKTKASVDSSDLLQTTTKYNGEKISSVIKSNILNDYRRGISDGSLSLNENLYNIGDLIKYPDDRRVWRIVNKSFKYDGGYDYPIDVMQCLRPDAEYGLFNDYGDTLYSWEELVSLGLITVENNIITSANTSLSGVLKMPNTVTGIARRAFYQCKNIEKIYLSSNIENIGYGWSDDSFFGCDNLTDIIIDESNSNFTTENGVLFNKLKTKLIRFPQGKTGSYSIPDTVTHIVYFGGCKISEVSIPDTVTIINVLAFSSCVNIRSVTVPSGINVLNQEVFIGCSSLEQVILSDGVTSIGNRTFKGCTSLRNISIPSTLISVGDESFKGCHSLTTLNLPEGFRGIGLSAFEDCISLTNIDLPSTLTSIQTQAFWNCNSLKEISIPSGITSIPVSTFAWCLSLKIVRLSSSITNIRYGAFRSCSALTDVYYDNTEIYKNANLTIDSTDNEYLLNATWHYTES